MQRETPEHDWIAGHLADAVFASGLAAYAEHECLC
jgi:hypothetical protein